MNSRRGFIFQLLTLAVAAGAWGCEKTMQVKCPKCDGKKTISSSNTCKTCKGRGEWQEGMMKYTCNACNRTGRARERCDQCGGRGSIAQAIK